MTLPGAADLSGDDTSMSLVSVPVAREGLAFPPGSVLLERKSLIMSSPMEGAEGAVRLRPFQFRR